MFGFFLLLELSLIIAQIFINDQLVLACFFNNCFIFIESFVVSLISNKEVLDVTRDPPETPAFVLETPV